MNKSIFVLTVIGAHCGGNGHLNGNSINSKRVCNLDVTTQGPVVMVEILPTPELLTI